ncbi:MAG: hydroxyacid dehydrogenase [Syntrophobacteraceae bacterium]|nr:hydroxyacid dehydrogenase [Syntrophobacteraceae bacterium]
MKKPNILISHEPKSDEREIFLEVLGDQAEVAFLAEIPGTARMEAIQKAEVLICWSPAKEFQASEYDHLGEARLIQLLTAGADHVPFGFLPSSPVMASNVGAYAEPMAEHVLALALALAKRLLINHAKLQVGDFDQSTKNRMLKGLVCGILGYGGIGRAVAALMGPLGLKIHAVNTSGKTPDPVDIVGTLDDLEQVLRNADVLVVALPLTRHTRGLLDERRLSWMKTDAILINVARGAIIDEEALYRRLQENPSFMAAIDTWWIEPASHGEFRVNYPFFSLPNFLGSPHNSPVVPGTLLGAIRTACENVLRFLRGEPARGIISREDYA